MRAAAECVVRVLAVDMGSKRIGIAMSDALGMTAQPVAVLEHVTASRDIAAIQALVSEHGVARVVVGHPISLKGTPTPQTRQVEAFAKQLEEQLTCPVVLWDERLTSAQGERVLRESGLRRKQRRHVVNQVAAQLILQNYLEAQHA